MKSLKLFITESIGSKKAAYALVSRKQVDFEELDETKLAKLIEQDMKKAEKEFETISNKLQSKVQEYNLAKLDDFSKQMEIEISKKYKRASSVSTKHEEVVSAAKSLLDMLNSGAHIYDINKSIDRKSPYRDNLGRFLNRLKFGMNPNKIDLHFRPMTGNETYVLYRFDKVTDFGVESAMNTLSYMKRECGIVPMGWEITYTGTIIDEIDKHIPYTEHCCSFELKLLFDSKNQKLYDAAKRKEGQAMQAAYDQFKYKGD